MRQRIKKRVIETEADVSTSHTGRARAATQATGVATHPGEPHQQEKGKGDALIVRKKRDIGLPSQMLKVQKGVKLLRPRGMAEGGTGLRVKGRSKS